MNIKQVDTRPEIQPTNNLKSSYKKIRNIKSHNRKDYTGQKFGRLEATKFNGLIGKPRALKSLWEFKCECGNVTTKIIYDVVSGKTKSCGCLNLTRGKTAKNWKGYADIPLTYFTSLKDGASRYRNLKFDIDIKYIWELFLKQHRKCKLSGIDLIFDTNKFKNTASLDRIDSTKGYINGNVQWVHKTINFMKQNMSDTDFVSWCKMVSSHNA